VARVGGGGCFVTRTDSFKTQITETPRWLPVQSYTLDALDIVSVRARAALVIKCLGNSQEDLMNYS